MVNWINSWRWGNKKNKINVSLRLGKLTVLEIRFSILTTLTGGGKKSQLKVRFIVLNFGFQL